MTDLWRYALSVPAAWLHCVGTWMCELAGVLDTYDDDEVECGPGCICDEF